MKIKNLLTAAAFISSLFAAAQNECEKLLRDGLYSFTHMGNTGSFNKDIRRYFMSEQFRQDMRENKWGGSLTIPIKTIPFSISSHDNDERYTELRSKLEELEELSISSDFYQTTFSTIPNTNLYEAYVNCVEINSQTNLNGFIPGKHIETEDLVVFVFHYRPSAPGDAMPVVESFNVEPAGSVVSGGFTAGQQLSSYTIQVTCRRYNEKDLILTLNTNRGSASGKIAASDALPAPGEVPLGTVVASFLNFEQFSAITKSNEKSPGGIWTSAKSRWAPCDGRYISGSALQLISSQHSVPDLRGVFIRGLNSFDPGTSVAPRSSEDGDPDTRTAGSYQKDAFQGHKHFDAASLVVPGSVDLPNSPDQRRHAQNSAANSAGVHDSGYGKPRIARETRPKNVALYYYIRIN